MADGNITVEVSTNAAQAELARLRAENAALKRDLEYARSGLTKGRTRMREDNERLRAALELIAAPMRPDGTWNRDREACRELAAEALGRYEGSETPNAKFTGSQRDDR